MDFMTKLERLTDKLFLEGHLLSGVWEKYINAIEDRPNSGFELTPAERKKLMELIARAYEQLGNKAEAFAWRAKAMAEHINEIIPDAIYPDEVDFVACFKKN